MLDLYTAIVFMTGLILVITAVDVITNHLVSKKNKFEIVFFMCFYRYSKPL